MKVEASYIAQAQTTSVPSSKNAEEEASFAAMIEAGRRPTVAQFVAATGASAKDAVDIIYKYNDWNLYYEQAADVGSKERLEPVLQSPLPTQSQKEFQWISPREPDQPGSIVPRFHEKTGEVTGISYVDAAGNRFTGTSLLASKEEIMRQAMGYGIGTEGLDQFAQRLGAANFDSLEWSRVTEIFPDEASWISRYGRGSAL